MQYPLTNDEHEMARLEKQAITLFDPSINDLVKASTRILEIGCGTGRNAAIFRAINPNIAYTGIDIDPGCVAFAQQQHPWASFATMDARRFDVPVGVHDLVVIRLVLWSIGNLWHKVLTNAYRVLAPGGAIYSFEPEDGLLLYHPPRQERDHFIRQWQNHVVAAGASPFIGRLVPAAFHSAGLSDIMVKMHTSVAAGFDGDRYNEKAENLCRIFMSPSPVLEGMGQEQVARIREQFVSRSTESLIVDSYVVTTGRKS